MKKRFIFIIGILLMSMMVAGCGVSTSKVVKDDVEEEDITEEADTDEPVIDEPVIEEPVEENPVVEEPVISMSEEELKQAEEKILNEISSYDWNIFMSGIIYEVPEVGNSVELKLTKLEKAKIAAKSTSVRRGEEFDLDPGWKEGIPLNKDDAEAAYVRIFGEPADFSILNEYTEDEEGPVWYKGKLIDSIYIGETDTDIVTNDMSYYADNNELKATKELFAGHWALNHETSNYSINYIFTEEPGSEYGIVLSKIMIECISSFEPSDYSDTEYIESDNETETDFYGIWVGATKKKMMHISFLIK